MLSGGTVLIPSLSGSSLYSIQTTLLYFPSIHSPFPVEYQSLRRDDGNLFRVGNYLSLTQGDDGDSLATGLMKEPQETMSGLLRGG